MKFKYFNLHWKNCFRLNKAVFPSLVTTSPFIAKLKNTNYSHLVLIVIGFFPLQFSFWPKHWKNLHLPSSIQTQRIWLSALETSLGLWKLRSAPVHLFVCAVREVVDTTFQYHICLGYSRMFSRQSLKLIVAFKVWDAFFFIRFSCIRIEVSELDKVEICSMPNSFKKSDPHFSDDKLMQQKYPAY